MNQQLGWIWWTGWNVAFVWNVAIGCIPPGRQFTGHSGSMLCLWHSLELGYTNPDVIYADPHIRFLPAPLTITELRNRALTRKNLVGFIQFLWLLTLSINSTRCKNTAQRWKLGDALFRITSAVIMYPVKAGFEILHRRSRETRRICCQAWCGLLWSLLAVSGRRCRCASFNCRSFAAIL